MKSFPCGNSQENHLIHSGGPTGRTLPGSFQAGDPRDMDLTPGSGQSLGGGYVSPLQYSCLDNPMDKEPGRLQSTGLHKV